MVFVEFYKKAEKFSFIGITFVIHKLFDFFLLFIVDLEEHDQQLTPDARADAATHRSAYMWPWETEPRSIAHSILDDETYDWLAVCEGMIRTGGYPVLVDEDSLVRANTLARETTGIDVDHTGTAGLAGLMQMVADGADLGDETIALLFTGVRRSPAR